MRRLKYQPIEDYDGKRYRGGRGGRDGKEVWGRRPVETGHFKTNIWLIQSVNSQLLCTKGFATGWRERRKLVGWERRTVRGREKKARETTAEKEKHKKLIFTTTPFHREKVTFFSQLFFRFLSIYWNIFKQLQWVSNVLFWFKLIKSVSYLTGKNYMNLCQL